ncbi:MAG: transmembrane 220 family protein [Acidobacteriota bacterium]
MNCLMTAAFLFSVAVQYNDPDPLHWMAIYGAAAIACILTFKRGGWWPLPAAIGLIALLWALSYAPQVIGKVRFGELFEAFEMKDERVEVAREMGGLLIIAFWMAVLTVVSLRRRAAKS